MKSALKAGMASAALVAVAIAATSASAGDLADRSRGSYKDYGTQPYAQAPAPVVAGPCYARADIGYSVSNDPSAKWPVNNITRTWSSDPSADGVANHYDPGYTGAQILHQQTTYVGDEITNAKMSNSWLAEVGVGCGSGSRGFRGEVMFGVRGNKKFDGEPRDFNVIDIYPTDPQVPTVEGDPIHTNLKTYTMMLNAYYDLGSYRGFVPYVGAGIGVAYHRMNDVYFTQNPNLVNRIEGNNDVTLAWALMAGVAYQISNRAVIDFGYRYIDLGKASSGRIDNAGFANPRLNIDDITAHEFKVGLRYHFGTTGNCCTETVAYK